MGEKGNFKVKAIKDLSGWFTKDEIYEYKDGKAIVDYGERSGVYDSFEELIDGNMSYEDVLIEYKGDSKGNYKFLAIKDKNFFDGDKTFIKGTIYEVKDSKLTFACGWNTYVADTFEELMENNPTWKGQIVEYKEEESMNDKSYFGYEIIKMLAEMKFVDGQILNRRGVNYVVTKGCDHVYLLEQGTSIEPRHSMFLCLEHKFIIEEDKKITFLEAYKAYLDGAGIESCEGYIYKNGVVYYDGEETGETSFDKDELDGMWIIR